MQWEADRPRVHQKWKDYWYRTHPLEIAEESWEYLFTGGKEIRARLFCELWSYLSPDIVPCGELAFAIECIHAASLVLDDTPWMDNASTRRGRVTLHLRLSNKKALLLCHDVMYMVHLIWKENKPTHICSYEWEHFLLYHLQRLMMGQTYDLEKKGTLIELASLKTGVLFELVAETVSICTDLNRHAWGQWGNHLGILFQWMDDWHDREEDTIQNNRNAFNEAYQDTLSYYGKIWRKVEQVIGPSWFMRPFGTFMKIYFTRDSPLSSEPVIPFSLSEVFRPYPTPPLPTIPLEPERSTIDPRHDILINHRNLFDLTKYDIDQLLRSSHPLDLQINGQPSCLIEWQDLFHLEWMEWVRSFNNQHIVKIDGKRIIQIMLQVVKRLEHEHHHYGPLYETWKQKIWTIEETEWEYQSEFIDCIYNEIQLMKQRQLTDPNL